MSSLILRLERLPRQAVDVDVARHTATDPAPLSRWSAAAAAAQDACVVLDPGGRVVSLSAAAGALLDCSGAGVIGRRLADIVTLIDLDTGEADPDYAERIPPLAALAGGNSRSLIRVRHSDDGTLSLDVVSVPLHDALGQVVGSLSFLARLG